MNVQPHQPRVRVEWVLAFARVAMAGLALIAAVLTAHPARDLVAFLAIAYLFYSLSIVALVRVPVRFAPGWDYAVHGFDLAAFVVVIVVTAGAAGPFAAGALFLLVGGMVRWQVGGVIWSTVGAGAAVVVADLLGALAPSVTAFPRETLLGHGLVLAVVSVLMALLAVHQRRHQLELARLATWPRTFEEDPRRVAAEIIERSSELVDAPRVVLIWREPDGEVSLSWRAGGAGAWVDEPRGTLGRLVPPDLADCSFQTRDARSDRAPVVVLTAGGFRHSHRRAVSEEVATRFGMRVVQSLPLSGDAILGRIFFLDQPRPRIDDLILGDIVARLSAVRLESAYVIRQLSDSAAFKERTRVARDLHDSLLQLQAGAALELMAARRLLDTDPVAARLTLETIQKQLEEGEIEMRAFIRALRPHPGASASSRNLRDALDDLRQHLSRRWTIRLEVTVDEAVDGVPEPLRQQVSHLVQEGIVNAARHAAASVVRVRVSRTGPHELAVRIVDDGRGFPFQGTFDLAALQEMNRGPVTLRERVTELDGDLTLISSTAGAELFITLPEERAARAVGA